MATTIPANQAMANLTNKLVTTYKSIPKPTNFLETFFPTPASAIANTRYLYWAVRREGEPVAIDVLRGTEGNRNTFSITTDKIIDPPYFREYFDITQTDLYYRMWSSDQIDASVMADYQAWVLDHVMSLTNKIKRAYELQRANILTNGTITLADGSIVDFKRKAASMVTAGTAWSNASTATPLDDIEAGCNFIRKYGMAEGGNYICIMAEDAFSEFISTTQVIDRAQKYYLKLTDLSMPMRAPNGSVYQGRYGAGSYTVDVFTYPQFYAPAGSAIDGSASVNFVPSGKVFILPENPNWITGYAAVPYLPKSGTSGFQINYPRTMRGQFVLGDYMDERASAWFMDVKSAGIPLPTAIDQMYTLTT